MNYDDHNEPFRPRRKGKRPAAAPTPTNTMRDRVLLDHIINLTDQVRRLADLVRVFGLPVPPDIGTLGPAPEDVVRRLTEESIRNHFPARAERNARS